MSTTPPIPRSPHTNHAPIERNDKLAVIGNNSYSTTELGTSLEVQAYIQLDPLWRKEIVGLLKCEFSKSFNLGISRTVVESLTGDSKMRSTTSEQTKPLQYRGSLCKTTRARTCPRTRRQFNVQANKSYCALVGSGPQRYSDERSGSPMNSW